MNKYVSFRLYMGLGLAVLIVLAVATVTFTSLNDQEEDNRWIHHTVEVLQKVRDIRYDVVQMRGGRRTFWFTGSEHFIEGYERGRATVPANIVILKELVSDNPLQTANVNNLNASLSTLLAFWEGSGKIALSTPRDRISRLIFEEEKLLQKVYAQFETVKSEEQRLLSIREEAVNKSNNVTITVVVIGIIVLLLVVLVLVNAVVSTLKSRIRAGNKLKQSLDDMEALNKLAEDKNWVLSGVAEITNGIQSIDGKSDLSKDIIDSVVAYMELPAGAIYLYEEETETLQMMAAVAVSSQAGIAFKKGEGIVGSAALKREMSIFRDIPFDYWRIESALGKTSGKGEIVCVCLWVAESLKGVIELGSLNPFTERQLQLLESVRGTLAASIHTRQSRIKINQLLEQVQEQQEAMISQQEELRQTNEELNKQTQELLASEEELKTQEEELKQINTELVEKNDIVEEARRALTVKARELEATSKYKSEFLANMSHELRTPLNSVLILAKLLSDNTPGNLNNKQIEYAKIIHKSGSDLLQLINDILDLSKIEAGKIEILPEQMRIDSVVTDISQLFSVVASEKGIRYTIDTDSSLPATIFTDKQRVEQILKNLLSNAFKFTPAGGAVTVSFAPRHQFNKQRIGISVTDTGIGISPAQQQLIFEAFQQADGSTSRQYGGTGLGLSISKELVRLLGGEIELSSEEGKGSSFTLILPYTYEAPPPSATDSLRDEITVSDKPVSLENVTEQDKVEDDRGQVQKGDPTILIIEDDANFATILKDFARAKGFKTLVALKGDEGLLYARNYLPDAIILDVQLPVIDGWSLLKILKADEALKNIPVHIISAFDDNRLHTAGALAYIKKPVDREGLEKAFSTINTYLVEHLRKVLIISSAHFKDDSLEKLFRQKHPETMFEQVADIAEARKKINESSFDCVIADVDSNIAEGVRRLSEIQDELREKQIPLIIYLDTDISAADELMLKKVSDAIVRESPFVNDRLKDELELFLFKLQANEPVKETKHITPSAHKPINDGSLSGKKVLVVDDDMRNVFALSNLLESQEMQVTAAADGREALEALKTNKDIDIVLMDIMMPEMDGYEAMTRIRKDMHLEHLPIIALTAKAMSGDREKCIAAGASDYITKPVDTQKLLSLMRVWLSA
ncbi:response regulator [Sediminibacterium soli]|uniref:response regulator n=1 Tax=Sediminibacterium soli TaxID=2698829 RepID=UPI0013797C22|nr:response regulator [Sediminibacterium soli]NCI46592.1 response regulator [Sediminibacterium soli]